MIVLNILSLIVFWFSTGFITGTFTILTDTALGRKMADGGPTDPVSIAVMTLWPVFLVTFLICGVVVVLKKFPRLAYSKFVPGVYEAFSLVFRGK